MIKVDIIMDKCHLCLIKMNTIDQTRHIIDRLLVGHSGVALIITHKVISENPLLSSPGFTILKMEVLLRLCACNVKRLRLVKEVIGMNLQ